MTEPLPTSSPVYVSGFNAGPTAPLSIPNIYNFRFATWNVVVGSNRIGPQYELNNLRDRSLNIKLGEPDTFTFTISGYEKEASYIKELESDIWVYRDGKLIFRGRVCKSTDTSNLTADIRFTALGPEYLLSRRALRTKPYHIGAQFSSSWTPTGIVEWLITHAENQKGMVLGLTISKEWVALPTLAVIYKSVESNIVNITVNDGDSIYNAINTVCQIIDPDVEFWIEPDLTCHLAYTRGQDQGVILDYGGVLSDITRSFDDRDFANSIRATGSIPGVSDGSPTTIAIATPSWFEQNGVGIPVSNTHTDADAQHPEHIVNGVFPPASPGDDPRGGWHGDRHADLVRNIAGLDAFARNEYYKSINMDNLYSYDAQFAAGQWRGPDYVWVGDKVWVYAQRGRIDVRQQMRVVSLNIGIDSSGIETVKPVLNLARDHDVALKNFRDAVRNLQKK